MLSLRVFVSTLRFEVDDNKRTSTPLLETRLLHCGSLASTTWADISFPFEGCLDLRTCLRYLIWDDRLEKNNASEKVASGVICLDICGVRLRETRLQRENGGSSSTGSLGLLVLRDPVSTSGHLVCRKKQAHSGGERSLLD